MKIAATIFFSLAIIFVSLVGLYFIFMSIRHKHFQRFFKAGDEVNFFIGESRERGNVIIRGDESSTIEHADKAIEVRNDNLYPCWGEKYS